MIYLDNHRATRPSSKVQDALARELWLDPAAPYYNEVSLLREVEHGIANIYELTGASGEHRLIVTGGERDAAAKVFRQAFCDVVYTSGKNFFFAPVTENAPIREEMDELAKIGCVAKYLPVNAEGRLTVEILERHLNPKVAMLSLSWANALTGVIHPIEEIAEFCKKKGILLYVQGSEMFAKLFMRLRELPIDYFSFSADLFHGPKGVGGLMCKGKGFSVENLPGLLGMGIAAGEVLDFMDGMNTETAYLRSVFESGISDIPGIKFFGERRLPNVSCFAIPSIHGELLSFRLKEKGILVSYGGGRVQRLEHILTAMGIESRLAKSAISVALSMDTSETEIKRAIQIVKETV